ncbi:tetratricopeptide repeat protein [Fluviicola taffensis]|uniref:Uncharacterized protein n=1 Tax=Fluviicola taffensis (strain DSM 16823 / NCIMB 13979 / RW262) TaxID=755732 RepID=F2IHZ9_FLUTR|nr:tetratricopeptide repeat protein [Fluviicola taffensis]AEA42699.1 hypothetical protein Fluta_0695 [Fluviicola taffensis DSM 16823]
MPRLYLVFFALISFSSFGQNLLGKYLDFADEQYAKGDYIYALQYYEKALELDSNSVSILWKYAESLRAYKDYRKASYYYKKVYEKEETAIYPSSLLQWALMEKQNGHYAEAIELFKRAKKKYAKDKRTYNYLKSKRELESCLWAQTALKDTLDLEEIELPKGLNTVNSEFGHTVSQGQFVLSSMRSKKENVGEEMLDDNYKNRLYFTAWKDSLKEVNPGLLETLNKADVNTGNGCFSPDGKRFYYSNCGGNESQFNCQIWVSSFQNGKWSNPNPLGEIINEPGTNNTTPVIAVIENEEWLIFSSNREDGKGGMDLYYSIIKNNGNQFSKVRALNAANSLDNDISPFYNAEKKRLYFSSSWYDGFGGYDVFYLELKNGRFGEPQNLGIPINSSANDLYYFEDRDSMYVSSNRIGVQYVKNPTCCSDIFGFKHPRIIIPETKKETLAELNKRLPVTLYFHNDVPDPRSKEPTTKVNYISSYNDYIAMLPEYRKEYAKGLSGEKIVEAEEDIESFFLQYVEQGVKDLTLFQNLLLEELQKGFQIRLNVRGFASPLAKTEYNVALTQRRIMSLNNYLRVYDNGIFAPYLDGTSSNGGKLELAGVPFGEYTANQITSDNPNDVKNSVFSRAAARERKIEIQSVSYLETDSIFFFVDCLPNVITLGKIQQTEQKIQFSVYNNHAKNLKISAIKTEGDYLNFTFNQSISPKGNSVIQATSIKKLPDGIFSFHILIYFEGYPTPIKLMVLGETPK